MGASGAPSVPPGAGGLQVGGADSLGAGATWEQDPTVRMSREWKGLRVGLLITHTSVSALF